MAISVLGLLCLVFDSLPLESVPINPFGLVVDFGLGLWAWPSSVDADRDSVLNSLFLALTNP